MQRPIQCPHCGNDITDEDALLCLFCGESLKREIGVLGKLRANGIIIVFLVLLAFALLAVFL
ncbi:MAG: zinc-ribbon domain-containing protein [Candidatus Omnitrophica bacterium]|nr:zinc-ribbon domain-containing protein [Candidatus Omnitrophota bacterium]